jgi:hypothetical protein
VQTKKRSSKLKSIKIFGIGIGLAALILQSSALKIVQTKKRSSKLGVFSYCTIYS